MMLIIFTIIDYKACDNYEEDENESVKAKFILAQKDFLIVSDIDELTFDLTS